jgi:hypothetical protein
MHPQEMMSEQSIQLCSQQHMDSSTLNDITAQINVPQHSSQLDKGVKQKPRFAEFACDIGEASGIFVMYTNLLIAKFQVFRYSVLVTEAVIPKSLWGSDANFKLIQKRMFPLFLIVSCLLSLRYQAFYCCSTL